MLFATPTVQFRSKHEMELGIAHTAAATFAKENAEASAGRNGTRCK